MPTILYCKEKFAPGEWLYKAFSIVYIADYACIRIHRP